MSNYLQKKYYIILALSLFLLLSASIILVQAQSSDAIAIRVLPNPEHYSATRWYEMQGFSGAPQSIEVDGYEAVRDGRTVYVNAGNVIGSVLYTNIYLLSFNQEAEDATVDIVSQILSRWKFNTNYIITSNCSVTTATACLYSRECPAGEYCLSSKAKMIRDTRRLSDLAEIKLLLEDYMLSKGSYPAFSAGSYIANHSVSVWPSWQKLFAQFLGKELPVDPINKLGACGDARFESTTCWDNTAQQFADGNPSNSVFDLPANSYAYVYTASPDGLSYKLFGKLEEGYGAATTDADISGGGSDLSTADSAPMFTGDILAGKTGERFNGYISVRDSNPTARLTVTINTGGTTWTGWSAAPRIEPVPSVPNQRRIVADAAGLTGNYSFTATLNNGLGLPTSITTKTFTIRITNDPPSIGVYDFTYTASTTKPLDLNFQVRDSASNYPLAYSLTPNGGHGFNPSTFNLNPAGTIYILNLGGYLDIATEAPIDTSKVYNYVLTATDRFGLSATDTFTITVKNNKPVINTPLPCVTSIRVGTPYPPCTVVANDPDGNAISLYSYSVLPTGLTGTSAGVISGTPTASITGVPISITATDEFGAIGISASYTLNVNTYCGDNVKQGPGEAIFSNVERRGGPANNGIEDCDGTMGLAISPGDSNISRMYACSPILCPTSGSCVGSCTYFPGPNGGYCGDNTAQNGLSGTTNFGEECDDGMARDLPSGRDLCDTHNVNGYGSCRYTYCGDGVPQNPNGRALFGLSGVGDEQCDDGRNSIDTDSCFDNCTLTYCGDGTIQGTNGYGANEFCDDAGANAANAECTTSCTLTYCGDGTIQAQNGVYSQGRSGTGNEECETDANCAAGFECNGCRCDCIPCTFDSTTFDYCCFT